jgi:hypothetical protein
MSLCLALCLIPKITVSSTSLDFASARDGRSGETHASGHWRRAVESDGVLSDDDAQSSRVDESFEKPGYVNPLR